MTQIWTPDLERPQARPLEPVLIQEGEQPLFALRDPLGLAAEGVAVPPAVLILMGYMNGFSSLAEIGAQFKEHAQQEIPTETLQQIVMELDSAHCLESENFQRHRVAKLEEFRSQSQREMTHAGGGYPLDAEEFCEALNEHFTIEGGPGALPQAGSGDNVRAIIAPHIDFSRGAPNYGWAYQALGNGPVPETVILLGTAHAPCLAPLTATRLPFDTPLGLLPIETDFVDALEGRLGDGIFDNELVHISEHSVEFQAVSLKHVFPDAPEMRIVPLICGSLHGAIEEPGDTPDISSFENAVSALIDIVAAWPRRVTVIAGADFAHVGPQFGDDRPADAGFMGEVEKEDRRALTFAAACDAEGFLKSFHPTRNSRRVCSVACVYGLLKMLPALNVTDGRVLNYAQSVHPEGHLAVTHASVAFT